MTAPIPFQSPVNIRDVARRAGVSASTVSRTLRGTPYVSQQTRDRVLRAASELAYVPSSAAFRLISGHTQAIAVVARFPSHWFFSEVIGGIERVLRTASYHMVVYNVGDPASRTHFFEAMPPKGRVDALMVVSASLDEAEHAALHGLHVPISVIGGHLPGVPRVGIDDEASAAMAVRHLILLGHRDIAMISFDPDDSVGRETTQARRAGFSAALRDAGVEQRTEWIVSQASNVAGGVRAMEQLLTQTRLPTAVFAMSDEMALGALQTLHRAGLRVPEQISLVGFDDHEMAPLGELTTISQPVRLQGEMAARLLLDSLQGETDSVADINLPTRLVVRGTTGPPPSGTGNGTRRGTTA